MMIHICQKFFTEHGIQILTKTKVVTFGVNEEVCLPIFLGDRPPPFLQHWDPLGVLICSNESMHHDLNMKKQALIGKVRGLQQELGKQDPVVFIKLVKTYLWDICDATSSPSCGLSGTGSLKLCFSFPLVHTGIC